MLIFAILWPILLINYGLGRIDAIYFIRIRLISFAYITILIPYILLITKSKYLKYFEVSVKTYIFAHLFSGR